MCLQIHEMKQLSEMYMRASISVCMLTRVSVRMHAVRVYMHAATGMNTRNFYSIQI